MQDVFPVILDMDQEGILLIADIPVACAFGMETRIAADGRGLFGASPERSSVVHHT